MELPLFEMYRGDDHGVRITVTDALNAPVDITGWAFKATLTMNPYSDDDADAPVKVDVPAVSGTDATNGIVTIVLPHEQTKNLVPGLYFFDVQREAYANVKTVFAGRVKVLVDATRRTG